MFTKTVIQKIKIANKRGYALQWI